MRDASIAYGIEPAISCYRINTKPLCMKGIQIKQADILVVLPEELLLARK